jgi:queuine tRNA-ribosyltransferase
MLEATVPHLPADRPRYLMGVGEPDDILHAVERGIDMFDCVLPTRAGRHAFAYTRFGKLNLKNAKHAEDPRPSTRKAMPGGSRLLARLSASSRQVERDSCVHAPELERMSLIISP